MERCARIISDRYDCSVLLKGGHLHHDPKWAIDFLLHQNKITWLKSRRFPDMKTHGTGCTYSAAITANLAQERTLQDSVKRAKKFVTQSIRNGTNLGPWMTLVDP
jgi:hydroxymethylpyrimidine/phosphomethylpyrimidine kinase